jgi:hypothetical protein
MIGRGIPDLFLVEMCAVFLKEGSMEIIQHKFLKFCISKISSLQSSNRFAHPHESYRTLRDGCLDGTVPGTSCQATIAPSLRDKPLRADALCVSCQAPRAWL